MLSVAQSMAQGQDDTDNGNQRADLDHCPRRPVQRHQVLAVAELQREQGIRFHDNDDS